MVRARSRISAGTGATATTLDFPTFAQAADPLLALIGREPAWPGRSFK